MSQGYCRLVVPRVLYFDAFSRFDNKSGGGRPHKNFSRLRDYLGLSGNNSPDVRLTLFTSPNGTGGLDSVLNSRENLLNPLVAIVVNNFSERADDALLNICSFLHSYGGGSSDIQASDNCCSVAIVDFHDSGNPLGPELFPAVYVPSAARNGFLEPPELSIIKGLIGDAIRKRVG